MMQVFINKLGIGNKVHREVESLVVYSYYHNGNIYIETTDYNVIENIEDSFINRIVPNIKTEAYRERIKGINFLLVYRYNLIDRSLFTNKNSNDMSGKGVEKVNLAIEKTEKFLLDIVKSGHFLNASPGIIEYVDDFSLYDLEVDVLKVKDIKTLKEMLDKVDTAVDNINELFIISFDFSDTDTENRLHQTYKLPLIESLGGEDIFLLRDGEPIRIKNREITYPIILVNSRIENATLENQSVMINNIFKFICDNLEVTFYETAKAQLNFYKKYGYDHDSLMFFWMSNKETYDDGDDAFDINCDHKMLNSLNKIVNKYEVTDRNALKFLKTFLLYKDLVPIDTELVNNNFFYYIISVEWDGSSIIPPIPASKNEKLFNAFFKVKNNIASDNRIYYLLSSSCMFPNSSFDIFIDNFQLHEISKFNKLAQTISRPTAALEEIIPVVGEEDVFYKNNVLVNFSESISDIWKGKIERNHISKTIDVRTLKDFPYVYENALKIFEKEGVPFKNTLVLILYDDQNKDMLGGYYPVGNSDNKSEIDINFGNYIEKFNPPFIVLNISSNGIKSKEHMNYILMHETRHYIDDILGYQHKPDEDKPYFNSMIKYLRSDIERRAFIEEVLCVMRNYSTDYVIRHWLTIKNRILRKYLVGSGVEGDIINARNIDKAYQIFIEERQREEATDNGDGQEEDFQLPPLNN